MCIDATQFNEQQADGASDYMSPDTTTLAVTPPTDEVPETTAAADDIVYPSQVTRTDDGGATVTLTKEQAVVVHALMAVGSLLVGNPLMAAMLLLDADDRYLFDGSMKLLAFAGHVPDYDNLTKSQIVEQAVDGLHAHSAWAVDAVSVPLMDVGLEGIDRF